MTKELTIKGRFFKEIAHALVEAHGFGTNKMVKRIDLESWQEIGNNPAEYEEFMEMGYLRTYQTTYCKKSRKAYNYGELEYCTKDTWIGLTAKGWAVANRYLNA